MNILILGGMSPRHQAWVRAVATALQPHAAAVRLLDYEHWSSGAVMDVAHEVTRAGALVADWTDYVVVAKSIGSVVTTLATAEGGLRPQRCLFMGFPLKVVLSDFPGIAAALHQLPPTTFLHNVADPLGDAEAVRVFLAAHPPRQYALQVLPGDTHDYVDYELIARLASSAP